MTLLESRMCIKEFESSICKLWSDTSRSKLLLELNSDLMSLFVRKAFFENENNLSKVSRSLVDKFLSDTFLLKTKQEVEDRFKILLGVFNCALMEIVAVQKFSVHIIQQFIQDKFCSITDVFGSQKSCIAEEHFHLQTIISKAILTVSLKDIEIILFVMKPEDVQNWENYLVVLNVFLKEYQRCALEVIKRHTEDLVKMSFHNSSPLYLKKALLIGRQIASNSTDPFPFAYHQWFLTQFGDCLLLREPRNFSFFIEVLTSLLPYEKNVDIIKKYLERPLVAPAHCLSEHSDYISLLKTRINDMEPRIKPEEVIEKLLLVFQDTKKIPAFVMEASLMKKHYYLNEFLPALLKPRIVPSPPDVREKFIDELYRSGKIPPTILKKYHSSCQEEKQMLLTGILEDNFMDYEDT